MPEWLERTLWIVMGVGLWMGFWLWCVDWRKLRPVLREGGWAPVVLLGVIAAGAWAAISPDPFTFLGFVALPNFWWQLGAVFGLIALALLSGWLQYLCGFFPPEYAVEPPAHHDHGHGHGHDHEKPQDHGHGHH